MTTGPHERYLRPEDRLMSISEGEITRLLHEADEGRAGALDEVMELVYRQLSSMAESHLRRRYGPDLAGAT